MFDLALSKNGDILFEQNVDKTMPLKISFFISKANPLRVSFYTDECFPANKPVGALAISFEIEDTPGDKKGVVLSEEQAMAQLIEFRLNSAKGQILDRESIGSQLEYVKHKPLHDSVIQTLAMTYVKEAIADIMPNAEVNVEAAITYDGGYSQGLNIYIYNEGLLIFKYQLKE